MLLINMMLCNDLTLLIQPNKRKSEQNEQKKRYGTKWNSSQRRFEAKVAISFPFPRLPVYPTDFNTKAPKKPKQQVTMKKCKKKNGFDVIVPRFQFLWYMSQKWSFE